MEPLGESRIASQEVTVHGHCDGLLFVHGTVVNQTKFYWRFDAVVLLSAPLDEVADELEAIANAAT